MPCCSSSCCCICLVAIDCNIVFIIVVVSLIVAIIAAIIVGGRIKTRPYMVNGWELVEAGIAQISGKNAGKTAPVGALPPQVKLVFRLFD